MPETVDELTCEWVDDDGTVVTKQLDKVVLTKGAWATVMYLYQDLNRRSGEYGKRKARIQRYQKSGGHYRPKSKFNISSTAQARQIADVLSRWADERGD